MNFEFMTIDTPLPPCMPFPRALTGFPVSSTASALVYAYYLLPFSMIVLMVGIVALAMFLTFVQ